MKKERFQFYKEHPKTCAPDDFWGQVKRTVNGKPVSQEQIDMIVAAVIKELDLKDNDVLLDLCCGNGALTALLAKSCQGVLGVDFSEHLISIADQYFAKPPKQVYLLSDVVDYCLAPENPEKFTKVLCYGSFPFIEHERAKLLFCALGEKFTNVEKVFIGNCPDKNMMSDFYGDRQISPGVENDPDSPIGIWRSEAEFMVMAKECGWKASIHKMDPAYYAAHYRYDVVLTR